MDLYLNSQGIDQNARHDRSDDSGEEHVNEKFDEREAGIVPTTYAHQLGPTNKKDVVVVCVGTVVFVNCTESRTVIVVG